MAKKHQIFLITSLIFIGEVINYLVVKINYAQYLDKKIPSGTPNELFFDIAWLVVYILMAVSAQTLIINDNRENSNEYLYIFSIAIVLNILMSFLFYTIQFYYAALFVNIILILSMIFIEKKVWKKSKQAALLLTPFSLMVSSAAVWLIFFIAVN